MELPSELRTGDDMAPTSACTLQALICGPLKLVHENIGQ